MTYLDDKLLGGRIAARGSFHEVREQSDLFDTALAEG